MPIKPPVDPRFELAKKEVIRLVMEHTGRLDFHKVINMVPKRSQVFKEEAKCALVHMINNGELLESPAGWISLPEKE